MPLVVAALAIAASDVRNPALAEGIRLYEALDYAGALQALTQALDRPSNKSDAARIHLYIGLIQNRYKLKADAEASFGRAIDYDPRVRLPKSTPLSAKAMFKRIKKDKLGIDEEVADPPPKKKKPPKKKTNGGEVEDEPEESGAFEEEARTSTASSSSNDTGALAINTATPADEPDPVRTNVDRVEPNSRILPPTAGTEVGDDSSGPIVGWISIGVGVAAVATGVTFGVLANSNGNAAQDEPVASRAQQLHNTAIQQRTLAFVSIGVGGAAFGLAALMFLTDDE
jgi:hypothetical protein